MADLHRLRATFEEAPELYERARPTYPPALFDDLAALAGLSDGSRVLEIGPGTGKATRALAQRGYRITGVELGERLAAIARTNVAAFPRVQIVTAAFEGWAPPAEPFDAVVAFTAFHWIEPDVRYSRPAELLRKGGALAAVSTQHVFPPGADPFWIVVQEDYDAVLPSDDNAPPPPPEQSFDWGSEVTASRLFRVVATHRHLWDVTYTADEYIAVLATYSANSVLDPATRERLFARIHARITAQPGGTVRKTYTANLTVARRR